MRFALIGSGETSPTMVAVHRRLVGSLPPDPTAVLLATPYGFQENAEHVSAKSVKYFADGVGLQVVVAPEDDPERAAVMVRRADWVFSGPGSPTYALSRWIDGPVARALRDRVTPGRSGGDLPAHAVTVLASAAAVTTGMAAVPVYEIYKAGEPPHWRPGLDLTAGLGLEVAVIPHFDNTEGGTHDTRFCYLGERRLTRMERELPDGAGVLGIDEHTAMIVELDIGQVEILGRGGVTIRRSGVGTTLPSGTLLSLDDLVAATRGEAGATSATVVAPSPVTGSEQGSIADTSVPLSLPEIVQACVTRFDTAASTTAGDAGASGASSTSDSAAAAAMVGAILELESAITEWAADTEEDQGTDQARDVLRGLVVRLGDAMDSRVRPEDVLDPVVEPLLKLRQRLRQERSYATADEIRTVLVDAGIEINDGVDGSTWRWHEALGSDR